MMPAVLEPIYTTEQVRALEQAATVLPEAPRLMERAGLAGAHYARSVLGQSGRSVLVLAGPGNNGGDAFEVAAHLKRWFYRVSVVFAGDSAKLSGDAAAALAKWKSAGGTLDATIPERGRFDLAIDGLFGIGLQRPLQGRYAELIRNLNASTVPVLALDVPSGIDADTGAVMGCAVRARHTITFIGLKPGLLTLDGPDHCGGLKVDALGLEREALHSRDADAQPACGRLLGASVLARALSPRPRNFHKGLAGDVVVLGGARGMAGAAMLAGRAALKSGAGRVYVCMLGAGANWLDNAQPELMLRPADAMPAGEPAPVIAAGPGMGAGAKALRALRRAIRSPGTLILDADALNLIGVDPRLAKATASRGAATLLTPHPAEAARLLGSSTRKVQSDRLAAALEIARRYRALVALKGLGTVVAEPRGAWWINPSGNPGMAAAGMGDALTGLVAGLAAQGATPLDALLAGVWLHGAAGDAAASAGPLGITASELIESARALLNRTLYPVQLP